MAKHALPPSVAFEEYVGVEILSTKMCGIRHVAGQHRRVAVDHEPGVPFHFERAKRQLSGTDKTEKLLSVRNAAFGHDHPIIDHKAPDAIGIVFDRCLYPFFA